MQNSHGKSTRFQHLSNLKSVLFLVNILLGFRFSSSFVLSPQGRNRLCFCSSQLQIQRRRNLKKIQRNEHNGYDDKQQETQQSIVEILQKLDALNIRYPPTATRIELETILFEHLKSKTKSSENLHTQEQEPKSTTISNAAIDDDIDQPTKTQNKYNQDIADSIHQNDSQKEEKIFSSVKEIRQPPQQNSEGKRTQDLTNEEIRRRERRRQRRQIQQQQQLETEEWPWQSLWTQFSDTGTKTMERTARKVRRISRRASDYLWMDPETGVRNVRYKYVEDDDGIRRVKRRKRREEQAEGHVESKEKTQNIKTGEDIVEPDPLIEVPVEVIIDDDEILQKRVRQRKSRSSPSYDSGFNEYENLRPNPRRPPRPKTAPRSRPNQSQWQEEERFQRERNRRPRPPSPRQNTYSASSASRPVESTSDIPKATDRTDSSSRKRRQNIPPITDASRMLPPSLASSSGDTSTTNHKDSNTVDARRKIYRDRKNKRKVYSPYTNQDGQFRDDKDLVDIIGEVLVNAADQIFTSIYDDDDDRKDAETIGTDPSYSEKQQKPHHQPTSSTSGSQKRKGTKKGRHWKDRMEQRLEKVLGIHEDGEYYNRWTQQVSETKEAPDTKLDGFAVAQGEKTRRRRKDVSRKPIWDQDGNLISLLFGRGVSKSTGMRTSIFYEKLLDQDSSGAVLTTLIKATFQTALMMYAYLCRWASANGALPQPFIVLCVSAAGVSSRSRRLRAMFITLLLMRTLAELTHSYKYGSSSDGWDSYESDDDYEDDDAGLDDYDDQGKQEFRRKTASGRV